MRRFSLFLISMLVAGLGMLAQNGLNINKVFGGKYVTDPQVSETVMTGDHRLLRKRNLTTLATFSGPYDKYASILQPLVLKRWPEGQGTRCAFQKRQTRVCVFYSASDRYRR